MKKIFREDNEKLKKKRMSNFALIHVKRPSLFNEFDLSLKIQKKVENGGGEDPIHEASVLLSY